MTRKSAFAIAGGVVTALAAGILAMTVNIGVLRASETSSGPGELKPTRPVIRTVTQTKTVHKKARPKGPAKTVVVRGSSGSISPVASSSGVSASEGYDDDGYDDEDEAEHEHEDEHEDEHEFDEGDDD